MLGTVSRVDLDRVRSRLRRDARLFDQPEVYVAGVEDAVAAIVALADGYGPDGIVPAPADQKSETV